MYNVDVVYICKSTSRGQGANKNQFNFINMSMNLNIYLCTRVLILACK